MLITIVFGLSLFFSIVLIAVLSEDIINSVKSKNNDIQSTLTLVTLVCLLWSWLFYLLN